MGAAKGGLMAAAKGFTSMANKAQWAGRQLQTNFTLPIMVAGGFAIKFALDNEKAMTKLSKVYGDGTRPAKVYQKELDALSLSMRLLSEKFGVQQDEVINIGAAWAAAGAQGRTLAMGVSQTLRTMVVGELDAVEATKALISIQAQWGESSDELAATMNMLNTVENQSAVNLKDLVDAYARASGSAKNAGVTQEQLAVDIAALVPAAGSAAAAGNGLKTIYSKLIAPTQDAVDVMHELGIETSKSSWNNLTASDRLDRLAEAYKGATRGQRSQADAVIFGRYQLNRASVLLDAVAEKEGARSKLLKQITNATNNQKVADQELQKVMESNPQKLKQLGVIAQNVAADLGTKLVPALMAVASVLTSVFKWFNRLDPTVRKLVVGFLLFMAVIGPIMRWVGALGTLIGWLITMLGGLAIAAFKTGRLVMVALVGPFKLLSRVLTVAIAMIGRTALFVRLLPAVFMAARTAVIAFFTAFRTLAAMVGIWNVLLGVAGAGMAGLLAIVKGGLLRAGAFLIGWPGLILIAVLTVFVMLKDQIVGVFKGFTDTIKSQASVFGAIGDNIVAAFHKLPVGIQNAMLAVVRIVKAAVMAVYNLFSYLNPFAHHSPSLVENVTRGMAVIQAEFAKLPAIAGPINKAYVDIKRFKELTKDMMQGLDSMKRLEDLKMVQKYAPQAAGAFRVLVADLQKMQPILDVLETKMDAQQRVVDAWKDKLDAANDKLQVQQDKLDGLQKVADGWSQKLSDAQARMDKFTGASITGLRDMEDAIFGNEMAQKALQLQMMDMESTTGPIEDLQSRMDKLNGTIDVLRGTQQDLRDAGAGSDVLSVYDDQIAALEAQQGQITETASEYDAMKAQLEALQRQGERMDLVKSLNFDGLQREIQQASESLVEMPFDQIIAGVQDAKADVDRYQTSLDAANAQVAAQQVVVDKAQAAYDKLNVQYEREQKHLDAITEKYEKMREAISDVKSALDDVAGAAEEAYNAGVKKKKGAKGEYVSPAVQNFRDAASGDFPVGGGKSGIGGPGNLADIDKFNADIAGEMKGLTDSLDMFAPLKQGWGKFKGWWDGNVVAGVKSMFKQLRPGTDVEGMFGSKAIYDDTPFFKSLKAIPTKISEIFHSPGMIKVGDVFENIFHGIAAVIRLFLPDLKELAVLVRDKVVKAFHEWGPALRELGTAIGNAMKWITPLVAIIGGALLLVLKVVAGILINLLGNAFDVIIGTVKGFMTILTGLINFLTGVFTLDFGLIWEGIKQIFTGAFEAIIAYLGGIPGAIWAIIKGLVEGIIDFFVWLWDELVGHSIIPDMINAIVEWFKNFPGMVLNAIGNLIMLLLQKGKDLIQGLWNGIKAVWEGAKGVAGWIGSLNVKALQAVGDLLRTLWEKGKDLMGGLWGGIKEIWENIKTWIGDRISWIVTKFGELPGKMSNIFSGMFDGIKSAFTSIINWIIGKWNNFNLSVNIPDMIPGLPDKFELNTPDIPYLAKGGRALKNKMHVIGENGPELFVPGATGQVFSNANLQDLVSAATKESLSMLSGAGVGATVRSAAPGEYAAMAAHADRRVSMASGGAGSVQQQTVNNHNEYHFHGDLSFPNITDADDADKFLTNLSDLAG